MLTRVRGDTGHPDVASARPFYRGWYVVGLGMLMSIIGSGPVYYAFGNYSVMMSAEFGASKTVISLGYTVMVLISTLGAAPVGWLADRWPIRRLCMIGAVGTASGFFLIGLSSELWQILLLIGTLVAMGDVFLGNVVFNYMISHWFERRRGLAMGIAVMGASISAIIFPPLTDQLFASVGWRATFLLYGLLFLLLTIPVALFAHLPASIPPFERRTQVASREARPAGERIGLAALIRIPAFWIISFGTGTMIGVNGAVLISVVPFAIERGYAPLDAAFVLSLIGGSAVCGKLIFGVVADRIDLRWAMRTGIFMLAVALLVLALSRSHALITFASIIFGLGLGGMLPVWGTIVAYIFGLANCGSALGATRAAMTPLAVACPLIAGQVVDRTGNYDLAWIMFAALLAIAFAVTFLAGNWARPLAD